MTKGVPSVNIDSPNGQGAQQFRIDIETPLGTVTGTLYDPDNTYTYYSYSDYDPVQTAIRLTPVNGDVNIPAGYTLSITYIDGNDQIQPLTIKFRDALYSTTPVVVYIDSTGEVFSDAALTIPLSSAISILNDSIGMTDTTNDPGASFQESISLSDALYDAHDSFSSAASIDDTFFDGTHIQLEKVTVGDVFTYKVGKWDEITFPPGTWNETL